MSAAPPDLIPLLSLPGTLPDAIGIKPPLPYRSLYGAVLDGLIRTTVVCRRHYVVPPDLPDIARKMGLSPVAAARFSEEPTEHIAA